MQLFTLAMLPSGIIFISALDSSGGEVNNAITGA